ncbi:histone-fold-containing protein [Ganoderma leucocontextum]|nr:histone-fold-containing protein [Ganoderma leucocontextum]
MPRAKEPAAGASTAQAQQDAVSEGIDNFELPRSLIMKLARASQVPENTKFSKDVILSILKASTVFVNYLGTPAHEVASSKQHKSISATDVLKALELVEFTDIAKAIQGELPTYREMQRADKRKGGKAKAKDTSESASAASKPKGKGKAAASSEHTEQQAIPTIHIRPPTSAAQPASEAGHEQRPSEDVDEDQEMLDEYQEDGGEDVDEEMEDEDGDEDEPEDTMALLEEEERRDEKGLDADDAIEED